MTAKDPVSAPTVSVVVPFYNTPPKFLREAIESVLTQSYPAWELLLVDDGSTNESTPMARSYASKDRRVWYLAHPGQENRGLSASRNLGIQRARGDWIAFLDSDDVWLPIKLEEQLTLLQRHPEAAMLYGNTVYWYSWSGNPSDEERDFVPELGVATGSVVPPPRLLPLFLTGRAAVPCPCSVLAQLGIVREVGGFEASAPALYEDQYFYAKMSLRAPILAVDTCWDRYRQHGGSLCGSASRSHVRESRRAFLDWLEGYLSVEGIEDRTVWRAVRREQWKLRHPRIARVLRTGRRLVRRAFPAGVRRAHGGKIPAVP